jgi:hypothetical protein
MIRENMLQAITKTMFNFIITAPYLSLLRVIIAYLSSDFKTEKMIICILT